MRFEMNFVFSPVLDLVAFSALDAQRQIQNSFSNLPRSVDFEMKI